MRLNEMDDDEARAALRSCCASTAWIERMMLARPFGDVPAVLDAADRALAEISEDDLDEALAGHPRIGDRPDNASSAREQSGVAGSSASVLAELRDANVAYEARFGHVYLVFANGRPADELLAILRTRMTNDASTERRVLRAELAKINRARLLRMLSTEHAADEGISR
ncbi:2-oxo-4-hydroxy-4-carboxy-5-ureidoimidazoline decarboxylase [Gordonia hongkongensis]|uniref:2-oxo-4-hydroxy-4-carboxy-5-ureidoimidazoline decarboxylase n=1 Tax=Gordonia hongkongensis TaxID=1701090 RepID=A0AAX3TBZ7_9ACTN|nr:MULTISPECIES: 2-oxo-4-hydroxy-4-carboxy-5-ureidoimidazoline decarboxylase [Gordonia]KSU59527.1 OHCU decarboxylase [Gordonia sp. SGD-V-85]QIK48653.1 2-oxo-4-hydroxy-4-carboxy-5-ureidoimidazoline decarboxylase [Gordonia terrae]WFP26457.1 2-oxo-4-hydroxy-4-carboxy-5-ureidoimidazoline decarboxylase [Gordonia hongkongensis]SCB99042.1 2-oxo-4-hydroxy-4-carboxy-5-ureidoimidazoline decarboxylase [Gordonia sp. v-85]